MNGNRLTDLLALSHVPRWSIVDHVKPQYVSDHVYRVLVIAMTLAERVNLTLDCSLVKFILVHDAAECRTADIPASCSNDFEINPQHYCSWLDQFPEPVNPDHKLLVKLADWIEAYTFITRYGVGEHAKRVKVSQLKRIQVITPNDHVWHSAVNGIIEEIEFDYGR